MKIEQFEDKGLAHFSYAILGENNKEIILVDPARNPQLYYDYAEQNNAKITGVIESHPHADFLSSHFEIHQATGATIYVSKMVDADYPHIGFDEGDVIEFGEATLKALNTPGHSPDSISIVVAENGKDKVVFTGDTLFIGDVGRPDLREKTGNMIAKREDLARQMYHSTRNKLMKLNNDVVVYPAHGAGSLCGKALSNAQSSTIGAEKMGNYALADMTEDEFVDLILQDQPFIPKYFSYNVALNKQGAPSYEDSLAAVKRLKKNFKPAKGKVIIDGRPQSQFKESHFEGAINIQNGTKFETWLGSIVDPEENFYLMAGSGAALEELIQKAAKIGYELNIIGASIYERVEDISSETFHKEDFLKNKDSYTIVDIRNISEIKEGKIFDDAVTIPLHELRERADEIPKDKPVVVHCAGGYRSAAGSSILGNMLPVKVLDMSEEVKEFKK